MSEHKAGPSSDLSAARVEDGMDAPEVHVDSPGLAPEHGNGDRPGTPRTDVPRLGAPGRITIMAPSRDETPRASAPRAGAHRESAPRDGAPRIGAAREHSWEDFVNAEPKPEAVHKSGNGRVLAIAAMIALAVTTGAIGGSMAMSGLGKMFSSEDTGKVAANHALEDHIARLDGEVAALRAEVDRNAKQSAAARAKSADRFDRLEKGQADPAAKLAKLSETVEKLRTAPAPAPVVVAAPPPTPAPVASAPAKEVTGSITAPPPPKLEVARLPMLDGWRLIDVAGGGATIEGRAGVFEVYAGDPVPGLGRVDAIRKQDGRWTVITSRGLIVAR